MTYVPEPAPRGSSGEGRGDDLGPHCAWAATADITPSRPIELFGYADRAGRFTSVREPLEANILGITDQDGRPTYMVATDTLYGGTIARSLRHRLQLDEDQLVVFGSHTHFAPGVDAELSRLGPTEDWYVRSVVDSIAEAINEADWHQDVRLSHAIESAEMLFVNRRKPAFGLGVDVPRIGASVMAPNAAGEVDPYVRLAALESDGHTIALLWGASCHPVGSPDTLAVSSCFPGVVRSGLRHQLGSSIPILYLQGFSGDVRPNATTRRPPRRLGALVRYLAAGCVRFSRQSESDYSKWCGQLTDIVTSALGKAMSDRGQPILGRSTITSRTPPGWERSPVMRLIQVTRKLSILAMNAEVMASRATEVQVAMPGQMVIPAGCCDEVVGYWPSDEMLVQGGYEPDLAARSFPPLDWQTVRGPDVLWASLFRSTRAVAQLKDSHPGGSDTLND